MSKEYIEREAALAIVYDNWGALSCSRISYNLEKLPAVDVEPVRHGKWIPIVNHFHGKPDGRYYCSVCHRVETIKGIYCRLCGAKMDGGK